MKTDFKKKLEMIVNELKFLVKGIMRSPKSYTLWFHRQWILQKGLDFELTAGKAMMAKSEVAPPASALMCS